MKFNAIILSGLPGAGKGTLAKKLSEKYKWKLISAGELWRENHKKLYPKSEVSFEEYWKNANLYEQKLMDKRIRSIISNGNVIGDFRYVESCKDFPAQFIFITANLETRAKRALALGKYPKKTFEEVKGILKKREEDEIAIEKQLYGQNSDYRDKSHYNLVIDSSTLSIEQEIEKVDELIKKNNL